MGRSEIDYYNGRYKGSLGDETCSNLECLISLDKEGGCVTDLLHIIYNMADSDVQSLIMDYETYGMPSKEYKKPRGTLRDYQTIGVAFMYYAGNVLLGDSVGMGKTVEVAGLVNLLGVVEQKKGRAFRYLVLAEKNVAQQFRKELVKFTGEFVEYLPSGEARDIQRFTGRYPASGGMPYSVVGTHALLKSPEFLYWLESFGVFPFDMLVVDESSVLGCSSTTQTSKGYKAMSRRFGKVVFLNATPFETKLGTFYNQLNLLDSRMLPTKANFQSEYCIMRWNGTFRVPTGKYKNTESFRRLVGYFYFARTRRDKGARMEGCRGGVVFSPLSPVQKAWLGRTQLNRVVFDCPNYLDSGIRFDEVNVPKLGSLRGLLEGECGDGDTVLVFVHYKVAQVSLSGWLDGLGYPNRVLNGDTPQAERLRLIAGFQQKEFKVLITNVQRGLNFGDCNYCIFYSFDPNPSRMLQFEGRTTRDFNIVGKNVYILCSEGLERRQLTDIVRQRAQATVDLTNVDISVVMDVLLKGCGNNDGNQEDGEGTQ